MSDAVVNLKLGKIQGVKLQSAFSGAEYCAFYGVPYAQPPVGDLRFKDPVKIKPWKSIKDATSPKGGCAQVSIFTFRYQGSEDCLYVNVYTPRIPKKGDPLMPVIACIPLGGLQSGSPDPDHQGSPDFFMHHDIVYVGISHRLHILGFMNLHMNECPGNMGLKDMIMAFEWIQENIKAFGGDPDNVTALGSSSGATMIHAFLLAPAVKPLFHKAILMGDYIFNNVLKVDEDNSEYAFEFARGLGFNGDNPKHLLSFLKTVPVNVLVTQLKMYQSMLEKQKDYCKIFPSAKFLPTIDADAQWSLVPCNARKFIPQTKKIPIMYGQCQKEAILGFTKILGVTTEDHFKLSSRQNCWGWMNDLDDESLNIINDKVEAFYYKDYGKVRPLSAQIDVISDTAFSEVYETVVDLIADECPVYVYKFEYEGELGAVYNLATKYMNETVKGTYHADDFSYWTKMDPEPKVSDRSREMIKIFTKLIVNFATTGNPNDNTMKVEWKTHKRENPCYLSINETLQMIEGRLNNERAIFWDEIKREFKKPDNFDAE
ncbi:esterase FE4-like [Planococcus citri]|uniref:esterase FE4-like n=1 Tax=Planococcus citri TaxID=170843 RepID=UPI0031F7FF28